eukprot:gene3347-3837_t
MASTPQGQDYFSSPFNVVFGNTGPQHEKALKQAFYNTTALVFVFLSGTIAVVVYYVLEAFIRPLLWAALCGTFLHPFQKTATAMVRSWLNYLDATDTPFAVGFAILPFKLINDLSDFIGKLLKRNVKVILLCAVIFPILYYLLVFQPFLQIFHFFEKMIRFTGLVLERFQQPVWVWTLVVGYAATVIFWWSPSSSGIISKMSIPVWALFLIHLASYAGQWKVLIFFIFLILLIVGLVEEWNEKQRNEEHSVNDCESPDGLVQEEHSVLQRFFLKSFAIAGITSSPASPEAVQVSNEVNEEPADIIEEIIETSQEDGRPSETGRQLNDTPAKPIEVPTGIKQGIKSKRKNRQLTYKRIGKSDPYFICLFWVFVISRVFVHMWILQIVPILILIYIIKNLFIWFHVSKFLSAKFSPVVCHCKQWMTKRRDVIVPTPVRGIYKLLLKGDKKVIKWADGSVEKLISVFMILCLIVFTTMAAILLAIQVQKESSYMAHLVSSTVNETITANPELLRWLPENTDVQKALDSMVHRAYIHGREWMVTKLNLMLRGHHKNSSELENQMTSFVDNLYEQWMTRNDVNRVSGKTMSHGNSSSKNSNKNASLSLENLQKWFPSTFELSTLLSLVKENVDTLKALLESVWLILKSNANLAISFVTTVLSMIFFSSTYVLNTGLSSIVFLTALFYLLSASGSQYKVVEWISGVSMGTRFSESVNIAVRDVFGATLKMAAFYGFYTWTTHSIFGLNIVFIPSALAALLAAIPFIGTYFAAIPGALELWLVHGEEVAAIFLLVLHVLPSYVVDVAIYSEISGGGHPYLTGLAVAGGMYWFGLEGAIIGPIVLCCLIAAFNVYNGIFTADKENASMEYANIRNVDYTMKKQPLYRKIRRAFSEDR